MKDLFKFCRFVKDFSKQNLFFKIAKNILAIVAHSG